MWAGRYDEALDIVETSRRRCLEFFEDDDYSFELELLRGAAIAGLRGHERSSRTLLETYDRDTQWTGEAVRAVREYLGQRQTLVERTLRRTGMWTREGATEAFASVDDRGLLAQERELAFARCDDVLRVIPDCPSVLYVMASAHLQHNAIERATACLDRVPEDSGYRQNLYAIASEARGDFEQAVVHAKMALTRKPGYYVIRDNLGSFLARAGNPVGAGEIHSEIIAAEPHYAWAYANMAGALALQCRPDEALRFLGEALVLGYPPWRVAADSALDALRRDGAYRALLARRDAA